MHILSDYAHVGRRAAIGRAKCAAASDQSWAIPSRSGRTHGSRSRLCQWARAGSAKSYDRDAVAHFRGTWRQAPIIFQRSETAPPLIRPPAWGDCEVADFGVFSGQSAQTTGE